MKKLTAFFVTTTLLLNAMAPTLADAATYLQGAEIYANALVQDAYVAVTYYDRDGEQRLEKGWIDAVGEASFTIRAGVLRGKRTIAYAKVVSVIISRESTVPAKQMNEVNRFMREMRTKKNRSEKKEAKTEVEPKKREIKNEEKAIQRLTEMAPTLPPAPRHLQGSEVNANTLTQDAYIAVTYRDRDDKQKLEKGWIDAVGETSFTIRSGDLKSKKTIAYTKVVSVVMSGESTVPAKQMNEVNWFIRNMQKPNEKSIMVISDEDIDSAKVRKGWYAHVIYTSEGEEETVTGRITKQDSVHIVIKVQEERALRILKTIAYKDIDTLVISQYAQSIDAWKNAKQAIQLLHEENAKLRVNKRIVLVGWHTKVTQDTLILQRGDRFYQVPLSSISNLEVSIGQYRNSYKGSIIGFGIGFGILVLSVREVQKADDTRYLDGGTERDLAELMLLILAIPAAVLTTLTGALIGYGIESDKWVEVPPHQPLKLSLTPTSTKGLRAALTFNF